MEIITKAVEMFLGNKKILKGIDFKLNNKEFLGIIGPNGSGKSTFLKCMYRDRKSTRLNSSHHGIWVSGVIV